MPQDALPSSMAYRGHWLLLVIDTFDWWTGGFSCSVPNFNAESHNFNLTSLSCLGFHIKHRNEVQSYQIYVYCLCNGLWNII